MNRKQAINIRDRVLDDLPGPWEGRVWENLGWHVSWTCGAVSLHYSSPGFGAELHWKPFWCMVGDLDSGTGLSHFHSRASILDRAFATPQEAVRAVCDDAMKAIDGRLLPIINSVRSVREMVRE